MSPPEITDDVIRKRLERHRPGGADPALARVVADLSPGLSRATVVRVDLGAPTPWGRHVIVKAASVTTDEGVPGGFRADALGARREADVYETDVVSSLTHEVVTPALYASDRADDAVWLWLEDVCASLDGPWDVDRALRAVESIARLHSATALPTGKDWTSTEYDAFRHHVPQAREQVRAALTGPVPGLSAHALRLGSRLLDQADAHARELAAAPRRFSHGDFHIDNAGWTPDGRLLLIDWAQAGLGPLGGDIAVFLSNYRARGGRFGPLSGRQFDELVVDRYCRALSAGGMDRSLISAARRVIDVWSVSWAVQVRLGPGLAAARNSGIDEGTRVAITRDIAEGLERARDAAERLG